MDIFSLIKKNVSIETIVSEYTTLKKTGNYLKARCPFHHEKTASFTISPGKDIFYCFGCHQGGDVINFVSKIEQCSQKEAALLLASRFNIDLSGVTEEYVQHDKDAKATYFFVYNTVVSWLKLQLSHADEAKEYIKSRGINEKSIAAYHLGYFPSGTRAIQSLIEFCKKESILIEDLISCHIISKDGTSYYSSLEDRIIFPIQDILGRFCGFGGRIFKVGDTRSKYYNTQETDFFQKGNLLFGLFVAKEQVRTKKTAFIVEGYVDCILMAQYGYQHTVATLGTACTENQLKQISRYVETLYFLYDGDKAGKQALLRITEKCWKVNIEPLVIILPPDHDPASYILQKKTLDDLIHNIHSIFSFFIQEHTHVGSLKTLQEKINAVHTILTMILQIPDIIKQTLLLSQASKALEVDIETLKKEFLALRTKQPDVRKTIENSQSEKSITDNVEKILAVMLCNPACLDLFLVELCGNSENSTIQSITKKIGTFLENNQRASELIFDQLWNIFQEEEKTIVSKIIAEYGYTMNIVDFKQFCSQFERHMFKKMVESLKVQFCGQKEMLNQLIILQKRFKREI